MAARGARAEEEFISNGDGAVVRCFKTDKKTGRLFHPRLVLERQK
jgi:hypothetical protein